MPERPPKYPEFKRRLWESLEHRGARTKAEIIAFRKEHGFDPRSFDPWLKGERCPSGENLKALCAALGVTKGWLIYGDEPPAARAKVRRIR